MCTWMRMLKKLWLEHKTNAQVLEVTEEKKNRFNNIETKTEQIAGTHT